MPEARRGEPLIVLAIDPGRSKCGVAVVNEATGALCRQMADPETLVTTVRRLKEAYRPHLMVLGKGTGSETLLSRLREANFDIGVVLVDEDYTTLQARDRYFEERPPRGWRRLLPRSLLTPPEPYDDYVAVLLAERFLAEQQAGQAEHDCQV